MTIDNFWQTKTLAQMNEQEWESICDGCGKCCLHSFIDSDHDDYGEVIAQLREGESLIFSSIACQYIDDVSCGCTRYAERQILVPSCVKLTKENLEQAFFMPNSCSYRRLHEGRGLASWHPLLNGGSKALMNKLGISIQGRVTHDNKVNVEEAFEDYIVDWPDFDCD